MNKKSKNSFNIEGDIIYITRPEWNFIAKATVRDDYVEEIESVTWELSNNRYPYNSKYGALHNYIMKKWYGENVLKKMKDAGFVVDHMDNVSYNCCIENLCFLSNNANKAKGLTLDKEIKDKKYIALSMYKDFNTQLLQITIVFNNPAILEGIENLSKPAVAELAYFLYEGDNYDLVINDAQQILLNYKKYQTFNPNKLNFIDYHIEGAFGQPLTFEEYDNYLLKVRNSASIVKKAPIRNWNKNTKTEFLYLRD